MITFELSNFDLLAILQFFLIFIFFIFEFYLYKKSYIRMLILTFIFQIIICGGIHINLVKIHDEPFRYIYNLTLERK